MHRGRCGALRGSGAKSTAYPQSFPPPSRSWRRVAPATRICRRAGTLRMRLERRSVIGGGVVGAARFELTTYGTQNRRATRLRHAPRIIENYANFVIHCWTKNSYLSSDIIPRVHSSSHFSSWTVHYLKNYSFSSLQIRKTEMPKDLHVEKDVFMRLINICEAEPL